MKTTGLTLAEALATGRPFKHDTWIGFVDMNDLLCVTIRHHEFYSKHWQVQEEEKPPMRVWQHRGDGGIELSCTNPDRIDPWDDITESLAKALAPYLRGEG